MISELIRIMQIIKSKFGKSPLAIQAGPYLISRHENVISAGCQVGTPTRVKAVARSMRRNGEMSEQVYREVINAIDLITT